jgi:undecaprenyl diphosphate synthase
MFLFRLLKHFLVAERNELMEQNVRLTMIGRREGLPSEVLREFDRTAVETAGNTGMTLCLAINYGGRTEIADAARRLAEDVRAGLVDPSEVDEGRFASYLSTNGMPDPDLLIRTSGELRVSNFLLWQISYAEIWVTDVLWPDFRGDDLLAACRSFAARQRKFGGLPAPVLNGAS